MSVSAKTNRFEYDAEKNALILRGDIACQSFFATARMHGIEPGLPEHETQAYGYFSTKEVRYVLYYSEGDWECIITVLPRAPHDGQ